MGGTGPGFNHFGESGFTMVAGFGDADLWIFTFDEWEQAYCRLFLLWVCFYILVCIYWVLGGEVVAARLSNEDGGGGSGF